MAWIKENNCKRFHTRSRENINPFTISVSTWESLRRILSMLSSSSVFWILYWTALTWSDKEIFCSSDSPIPILRQERCAMRSFHDHDFSGSYQPGRHGVSAYVTSVVLDLHWAAASRIQRIPSFFGDESAVVLLGRPTRLLLHVDSRSILRGSLVEPFALVHHGEHHPDIHLELLFTL